MSRPNPSYAGAQGMTGDLTISTYPLKGQTYNPTSFFRSSFQHSYKVPDVTQMQQLPRISQAN
jgi:hypothetical protein